MVGRDAIPEAIEAVREGKLDATVLNSPAHLSSSAVDAAFRILGGEALPEWSKVPTVIIHADNVNDLYPK